MSTRDGLVYDLPEAEYHSGPELSSTGARTLLEDGGPEKFAWQREHPRTPSDAMDLGTLVHAKVLGTGWPIVVVDAPDWRTKAAQDARKKARAEGAVAVLVAQNAEADLIAAKVRAHPVAGRLFAEGSAEVSAFWTDERTGVRCRARFDFLPTLTAGGRPLAVDLKTTSDASPLGFGKSVANFGYHQQDDFYRRALVANGTQSPAFVFVAVETTGPYRVAVYELDPEALAIGAERNDAALERFRDCTESGIWPGLPDDIQRLSLPGWAVRAHDTQMEQQ